MKEIEVYATEEQMKSGDTFLMKIDGEWYKARKVKAVEDSGNIKTFNLFVGDNGNK